jgi:hypothetical protein
MITQQEFVADCYLNYAIEGLEPGNPEHGEWEQAHYPLPRSLGDNWVWLLKEHHAVQGVLQSIELQRPCIFSWERQYLLGEWEWLVEHFDYWQAEKGKVCGEWTRQFCSENPEIAKARGRNAQQVFHDRYKTDPLFYQIHHKRKSEAFREWNSLNREKLEPVRRQNAQKLQQYWKEHPEEYIAFRQRLSEKVKQSYEANGHPHEKKLCVEFPDGKVIEYRSVNEAARESPISRPSIYRMLEGKLVKKFQGFKVYYS